MERICGIYKITNKVNGKVYIGQSIDIKKRWASHKKDAFWAGNVGKEYPLYRAIRKYGLENFEFEIIEECTTEKLNEKEMYYITVYKSNIKNFGYNQNDGGQTNSHSLKLTELEVNEIIHRLKSTFDGPKQIAKEYGVGATTIHNINVGDAYHRDNEVYPIRPRLYTLQKTVDGQIIAKSKEHFCKTCGKKISKESSRCVVCAGLASRKVEKRPPPMELAKSIVEKGFRGTAQNFHVSDKAIVRWCKEYDIPSTKKQLVNWYNEKLGITPVEKKKRSIKEISRPIKQICINTGEVLNTFTSQANALRFLQAPSSSNHITQVCRGIRKSAYGYYWQYADEATEGANNT